MQKICVICETVFHTTRRSLTCSDNCRLVFMQNQFKKHRVEYKQKKKPYKICIICLEKFKRKGRWNVCSSKCHKEKRRRMFRVNYLKNKKKRNAQSARWRIKNKNKIRTYYDNLRKKPYLKKCSICGKTIKVINNIYLSCSKKCSLINKNNYLKSFRIKQKQSRRDAELFQIMTFNPQQIKEA